MNIHRAAADIIVGAHRCVKLVAIFTWVNSAVALDDRGASR